MTNAGAVIVIDDDPFSTNADDLHEDSDVVGNTFTEDESSKLNFKGFLDIDPLDKSLQGVKGLLKIFGDNTQQRERSAQVMSLLLQHRRFSSNFSKRGPAVVPACRPSFREQAAEPVQGMIAESVPHKKRGRPPGLTRRSTDKSLPRKKPGPKPGSNITRAMTRRISGENTQDTTKNYSEVPTRKKPGPKPGYKQQKKIENPPCSGEKPEVPFGSYLVKQKKKPGPKPGFKRQKGKQDQGCAGENSQVSSGCSILKIRKKPGRKPGFKHDKKSSQDCFLHDDAASSVASHRNPRPSEVVAKRRRGRPKSNTPKLQILEYLGVKIDPQPQKETRAPQVILAKRRRGRPTGYSPKLKKIVLKYPILSNEAGSHNQWKQASSEVTSPFYSSSTGVPMQPLATQPPASLLNLLGSDQDLGVKIDPQPQKETRAPQVILAKRRRGRPTGYSPKLKKIALKYPILSNEAGSHNQWQQASSEVTSAFYSSSTGVPMQPLASQPPASLLNLLGSDQVAHKNYLEHCATALDTDQSFVSTEAAESNDQPQPFQQGSSAFSSTLTDRRADSLTTKHSESFMNLPCGEKVLNQVT